MLLSPETYAAARRRFDSLLTGPAACAAPAIRTALEGLDPDDAQALVWCYAASPLSDWLNTPPALFRSLARHGVMLRRTSPYAAHLPEDIFLNHVLHPRVNEEELSDCRRAMYDELSPLLAGLPEYQAAVRVNYWNASQVTYRLTDDRTISASTAGRGGLVRRSPPLPSTPTGPWASPPGRSTPPAGPTATTTTPGWRSGWMAAGIFWEPASRRRLWTGAGSQRRQPWPCCCILGASETPWGRKLFPEAAW